MQEDEVNYCLRCGSALERKHRFGRIRKVCPVCSWVFFPDPKVAAAALVEENGRVLLVQRDNQPFRGMWTLPAGFVDAGEDPAKAAERECLEEAGLLIRTTGLLDVLSGQEHPTGAHIFIVYRAVVVGGNLTPGDDARQAAFFDYQELPPLAFSTTRSILSKL